MQHEEWDGHRPFLLKRSIGARILVAMALILLVVMIIMQVFVRIIISHYVEEYYKDVGELISALMAQELELYPDNIHYFQYSTDAWELQELGTNYNLYSIWVETSEPPYDKGHNQVYLPVKKEIRESETVTPGTSVFDLSPQEQEIFLGKKDSAAYQYKSAHGYNIIAYIHGIYNSNDDCTAIIGVNFDKERIIAEINEPAVRMGQIIAVIFIGLIVGLGIFLHSSVFNPLRTISMRMRDYASGGQLSSEKLYVKGEDELSRMAASYNKMTDEISEYVEKVGNLEKERLTDEAEMSVAAQIQTGMLPSGSWTSGQIRIDAVMKPAREVAGDFYDYQTLPDGRVFFCIADVSGKGISAALFMAAAMNAIRYNAVLYSSPAKTMRAANDDLCARNPEMLFVTAFAAVYDPAEGRLTWCNAGHNPAYLIGDGRADTLQGADCLFLGMFPDEEYTEASVDIEPENTLFLYTDGLTEAMAPDRKMYGSERMKKELDRYVLEPAEDRLTARLTASVSAFTNGAEAHDDLTMMAVRFGRFLTLPAETNENGTLRQFLLEEEGMPEKEKKKICLAAEEVFVNICRYAYDNKKEGTVRVSTFMTRESYTMVFTDTGMPYDPLETVNDAESYDPDKQIGGLGKLMTFTVMDRQRYEYRDGANILTLIRSLNNHEGEEL